MDIKIISYEDDYLEEVIALLKSTFNGVGGNDYFSPQFFNWKHMSSPHGCSVIRLAVNEKGDVVGFRAFMRWKFMIAGKEVIAYRPVDSAISKSAQGKGLFKKLTFSLLELEEIESASFIFNTPNRNSLPIYIKRDMGWSKERRQFFTIIPLFKLFLPPHDNVKCSPSLFKEYKYSVIDEGTCVSEEYLVWRYVNNPALEYFFININSNTVAVFRYNKRSIFTEAIILDVLTKEKYNKWQRLKLNTFKKAINAHYLLVTNDLLSCFTTRTIKISLKQPYINTVKRGGAGLDFNAIQFSARDLELF